MLPKTIAAVVLSTAVASSSVSGKNYYGEPQVSFPEPAPIISPSAYLDVFSRFQKCKETKCALAKDGYSTDISESIAVLGEYTSCVTGCSAAQIFWSMSQYKETLGQMFEIGAAQLVAAREYLAGTSDDYGVVEHATRIGESCCLPKDAFTTWDQILIPVTMVTHGQADTITHNLNQDEDLDSTSGVPRMISVSTYISLCTDDLLNPYVGEWKENLRVNCDSAWVEYLELLQHNIGQLIMKPETSQSAPAGSCAMTEDTVSNPLAEDFPHDICLAKSCVIDGTVVKIDIPIAKPTIRSKYMRDACPSDIIKAGSTVVFELKYERSEAKEKHEIPYYTLTSGLPSSSGLLSHDSQNDIVKKAIAQGNFGPLDCKFTQGLGEGQNDFYSPVAPPSIEAINAAKMCPYGGLFEYCNMQQYSSFLQRQLYDNGACQVVDMRSWDQDHAVNYNTLACLYKTVSMKCDCMEAVLNCYEHQFNFKDAMAGTIGKAASVLCGFILCLRPKVYSLFGGQHAVEQANIMRGLLNQVGLSVPSASSMPPATFAFLAFGIGMVAFVATKIVSKKTRKTGQDEGYAQLSLIHI